MSCILRVSGEFLDARALLSTIPLEPYRVWLKGEPRMKSRPDGPLSETSGVCFVASNASLRELDAQVLEATEFLTRHQHNLELMRNFPAVDDFTLDFGIALRDTVTHSDILTPAFLRAAADSGVTVELSHYPHSHESQTPC